jgi:hypothetical protein
MREREIGDWERERERGIERGRFRKILLHKAAGLDSLCELCHKVSSLSLTHFSLTHTFSLSHGAHECSYTLKHSLSFSRHTHSLFLTTHPHTLSLSRTLSLSFSRTQSLSLSLGTLVLSLFPVHSRFFFLSHTLSLSHAHTHSLSLAHTLSLFLTNPSGLSLMVKAD